MNKSKLKDIGTRMVGVTSTGDPCLNCYDYGTFCCNCKYYGDCKKVIICTWKEFKKHCNIIKTYNEYNNPDLDIGYNSMPELEDIGYDSIGYDSVSELDDIGYDSMS